MSGQLFCCFGFIWGGIDVEQTREETYSRYLPPGEHSPGLGIKGIQYSLSGETLPTGQASFKESRWHMWPCFPAWGVCCTKGVDNFSKFTCRWFPQWVSGEDSSFPLKATWAEIIFSAPTRDWIPYKILCPDQEALSNHHLSLMFHHWAIIPLIHRHLMGISTAPSPVKSNKDTSKV